MYHENTETVREKYKVWFFAGAETRDDRFNMFTGSFIRLMKEILANDFDYIRGVSYSSNIGNVIWALNNAQKPIVDPDNHYITSSSLKQIISKGYCRDSQLVITSSSSGSIVAAQFACYLAQKNRNMDFFSKPFNLVLGASMVDHR